MTRSSLRSPRFLAVLLGVAFCAAYLLRAPSLQHQTWDSLSNCSGAEESSFGVVNMDHPLGHIVLNPVYQAVRAGVPGVRALPVFQAANALLGGVAVALFFGLCVSGLGLGLLASGALAVGFGAASGMWRQMATGDIYSMVMVLSVAAWWACVRWARGEVAGWRVALGAGILAGLAFASYKVCGLLVGVGCLAGWRGWRRLGAPALFVGAALGLGALAYAGLGSTLGSASGGGGEKWALSQFGDAMFGGYLSLRFLRIGAESLANVLAAAAWNGPGRLVRGALLSGAALAVAGTALAVLRRGEQPWRRRLAWAAVAQIAAGGLLVQWWMPWSEKIWLPLLVPVMALAALGLSLLQERLPNVLPALAAASGAGLLLAHNAWFAAMPQARDTAVFRAALDTWVRHTQPQDTLVTAGDLTPHLTFWHRRFATIPTVTLYLRTPQGSGLDLYHARFREARAQGHEVYAAFALTNYLFEEVATLRDLTPAQVATIFEPYEWEPAFVYTNDTDESATQVFRLVSERAETGEERTLDHRL